MTINLSKLDQHLQYARVPLLGVHIPYFPKDVRKQFGLATMMREAGWSIPTWQRHGVSPVQSDSRMPGEGYTPDDVRR